MSIIALGIEQPYWQDIMLKLVESGIQIDHAVVHYRYQKKSIPNHFFDKHKLNQIDGKNFYRVKDISNLIERDFGENRQVLSKKILDYLEPVERDFYILTDRFSYFPISFRERKKVFREAVRYWLSFYNKNKISTLFITRTPHNLSDYTAYHVAKYLGIPTLQPAHTMINDFVILRDDYRGADKVPADFLKGKSEQEIISQIPEQLYRHATAESNVLKYVVAKNDQAQGIKDLNADSSITKVGLFSPKLKKSLRRIVYFAFTPPVFKGALAMNGLFPPTYRRVLRFKNKFWQKQQWAYHNKVAITPNLSEKYIYFAMHMQPERTSTPEAELFEDQLLAIEILARSLPEGWKLYVKENPRQFGKINLLKGRHMRDKSDYDDILRLPNTHIIRQDVSTKDLISNAQIVSTLSGSIGWETLQKSKPCIVFANAWYVECRSVFRVGTVAEAKLAIAEAVKKSPEDIKLDVLKYLAYMKDKYAVGCMGDADYIETSSITYEELMGKMAERLISELKQLSQSSSQAA